MKRVKMIPFGNKTFHYYVVARLAPTMVRVEEPRLFKHRFEMSVGSPIAVITSQLQIITPRRLFVLLEIEKIYDRRLCFCTHTALSPPHAGHPLCPPVRFLHAQHPFASAHRASSLTAMPVSARTPPFSPPHPFRHHHHASFRRYAATLLRYYAVTPCLRTWRPRGGGGAGPRTGRDGGRCPRRRSRPFRPLPARAPRRPRPPAHLGCGGWLPPS